MRTVEGLGSVFVTGAGGFIGRAAFDRFVDRGLDVSGVDLNGDESRRVVASDVTRPGSWQRGTPTGGVVIHTAAAVTNSAGLDEAWAANVLSTRHAIDAAISRGARRFVHLSSVRAFSDRDFPDGAGEHDPVRPDDRTYVNTKIASEQVVLQAHAAGEIECTIIRPADVYGPGSRPWTLIPVEMIRRRRFVLPAMGRGIFSPLFIDNLIDGIEVAVTADSAAGRIITIADGIGVTTKEFFAHYSRMLGMREPPVAPTAVVKTLAAGELAIATLRRSETEMRPASVDYLARRGTYSIDTARELLGYEPKVDLAEGMRRTELWLRDEGHI